jgi:hypothetical protein
MMGLCEIHKRPMRFIRLHGETKAPSCPLCAAETMAWFQRMFSPCFAMWSQNDNRPEQPHAFR